MTTRPSRSAIGSHLWDYPPLVADEEGLVQIRHHPLGQDDLAVVSHEGDLVELLKGLANVGLGNAHLGFEDEGD